MKNLENIPSVPSPKEASGEKEVRTIGDLSRAVYSDFFREHAEEIKSGKAVGEALKNAIETAINQAQHMNNISREKFAKYLLDDLKTNIMWDKKSKNEAEIFLESIINPETKREAA